MTTPAQANLAKIKEFARLLEEAERARPGTDTACELSRKLGAVMPHGSPYSGDTSQIASAASMDSARVEAWLFIQRVRQALCPTQDATASPMPKLKEQLEQEPSPALLDAINAAREALKVWRKAAEKLDRI